MLAASFLHRGDDGDAHHRDSTGRCTAASHWPFSPSSSSSRALISRAASTRSGATS